MTRTLLTSLGVALLSTIGCGGSPAAPSSPRGTMVGDTSTSQREVSADVAGKKPGSSPAANANALVICHRDGSYRRIEVNPNDEQTHLGHGDARPGEFVPADRTRVFDVDCRLISPVEIETFTNGRDADEAPGPRIPVGSTVIWTYLITNRSASAFTSLTVTDDRGVAVACPTLLPAPGQSVTCTGSGVAVAGQYRNVGTAVATGDGNRYTNSDESFYFGGGDEDEEEENEGSAKVQLCHRTGNGSYHPINVSISAERAHRAHGDAKVGEAVPGSSGRVFTASCTML